MKYLKLIRYNNLILLAIMQLIFRYGYLKLQNIGLALADWQYLLLVLSTLLIAAGGYVINDIFDQETDAENKPHKAIVGKSISESTAYNIYVGLTLVGVFIGYYLSQVILRPNFVVFFILLASMLYFYASQLKQMPIIGNIVVALLLSFSVLIIGIFDIYPATDDQNRNIMAVLFSIIKDYAIFAFLLNLIREIVKDIEDIKGDNNQGMKTLPIAIGIKNTSYIVLALLILAIGILFFYVNENLMRHQLYYSVIYSIVAVIAPLIFCSIKIWSANDKKEYHLISKILKWVIFFGILSVSIIAFNIKHNG